MTLRLWLLEFMAWRRACGIACGWLGRRWPGLGYAFGYHAGLVAHMLAWAASEQRWPAYWAVRDELKRRGYRL